MARLETINSRLQVAVVDDDENMRTYLREILQSSSNFIFAGSFLNAAEALVGIPNIRPHLALVDILLPDLSGIECTKRLKETMPCLKVVMITGVYEGNCIEASFQAGATAYLIKPINKDQLLATLQFSGTALGKNNRGFNKDGIASSQKPIGAKPFLSLREQEVLAGLSKGLLYKEISHQLGISYAAVHKHQHNIYKKLRVSNRLEAIRAWLGDNRP